MGWHSPDRARWVDKRKRALCRARALNAIARKRTHLTCIVVNVRTSHTVDDAKSLIVVWGQRFLIKRWRRPLWPPTFAS